MIRKILYTISIAAGLAMSAGCGGSSSGTPAPKMDPMKGATDGAKDIAKGASDAAKDISKAAKDNIEAGKDELAKLTELATKEYPAIETKINGLSGDAKTKASDAYAALKKAVEDAKAFVSDPTKMKAAWDGITKQLADLKKQVGL